LTYLQFLSENPQIRVSGSDKLGQVRQSSTYCEWAIFCAQGAKAGHESPSEGTVAQLDNHNRAPIANNVNAFLNIEGTFIKPEAEYNITEGDVRSREYGWDSSQR